MAFLLVLSPDGMFAKSKLEFFFHLFTWSGACSEDLESPANLTDQLNQTKPKMSTGKVFLETVFFLETHQISILASMRHFPVFWKLKLNTMSLVHRNVSLPSIKTNNSWTAQFNEWMLTVSPELTVRWKEVATVGMWVQADKWQLVSGSSHSSQTGGLKITFSTTRHFIEIQNHNPQQL